MQEILIVSLSFLFNFSLLWKMLLIGIINGFLAYTLKKNGGQNQVPTVDSGVGRVLHFESELTSLRFLRTLDPSLRFLATPREITLREIFILHNASLSYPNLQHSVTQFICFILPTEPPSTANCTTFKLIMDWTMHIHTSYYATKDLFGLFILLLLLFFPTKEGILKTSR